MPFPQKGTEPPPQFSAHFYCAQTAGCIKMPLGMEVGLSPGEFVLDGDPAPLPKRGRNTRGARRRTHWTHMRPQLKQNHGRNSHHIDILINGNAAAKINYQSILIHHIYKYMFNLTHTFPSPAILVVIHYYKWLRDSQKYS